MVTSTVPRGVHGHEHCTQRCTWSRALYLEVYMVMSTTTLNFQTHGRIAAEKVQMEQTLHEIQEKVHIVRCVCTRSIATPHHAVPHPIIQCHTPPVPHPIIQCHTPPVPHPIIQCHTPPVPHPIMHCHTHHHTHNFYTCSQLTHPIMCHHTNIT